MLVHKLMMAKCMQHMEWWSKPTASNTNTSVWEGREYMKIDLLSENEFFPICASTIHVYTLLVDMFEDCMSQEEVWTS